MAHLKAIDLFAGWGGFTEGAVQAGARVVWAANHWKLAVDAHLENHPETAHSCQDLRQADWTALPDFELLLAAPACQGHSTAAWPKRRPHHDALRATAWAVIDCAEVTRPRFVVVENVPNFRRWTLFPLWMEALRTLGYHVQDKILRASNFGVPQRRDRLFIVASREPLELNLELSPEPAFGPSIDFDLGDWRDIATAGAGARIRIAAGQAQFGERFLTQHVTGHRGIGLDEPIRTVTTQDHWAIVDGDSYRPLTIRENARAMGFPETYGWPVDASRSDVIKGLGNAVCPPVARELVAAIQAAA